jgi:hypothetical protein
MFIPHSLLFILPASLFIPPAPFFIPHFISPECAGSRLRPGIPVAGLDNCGVIRDNLLN